MRKETLTLPTPSGRPRELDVYWFEDGEAEEEMERIEKLRKEWREEMEEKKTIHFGHVIEEIERTHEPITESSVMKELEDQDAKDETRFNLIRRKVDIDNLCTAIKIQDFDEVLENLRESVGFDPKLRRDMEFKIAVLRTTQDTLERMGV
jgi:hypothetical protein